MNMSYMLSSRKKWSLCEIFCFHSSENVVLISWFMTSHSLVNSNYHLKEPFSLHHQVRTAPQDAESCLSKTLVTTHGTV